MKSKPRIAVVGTGGTIAGTGTEGDARTSYACSVLTIADVIATCPGLDGRAELCPEQFMQLGSENFTTTHMLTIAKRMSELVSSDEFDAVIVTQGTDTIEENAYFLNLTVKTTKPIVVVGSMRPPYAVGSDAQSNLYDAVCVATSELSRGLGVLVVANSEVHSARDVIKANSFKLEAFRSPYGPLGYVVEGTPRYYRLPSRAHTAQAEWSADAIESMPRVALVYAYADLTDDALRAQIKEAVGVVFVGTGNGNIPETSVTTLKDIASSGKRVVRATRAGSGVVVRNAAQPDDLYGWAVIDDQSPGKARVLLSLLLSGCSTKSTLASVEQIQSAFYRY